MGRMPLKTMSFAISVVFDSGRGTAIRETFGRPVSRVTKSRVNDYSGAKVRKKALPSGFCLILQHHGQKDRL